jgi:dTDP-4-dehydrorhamnose reductase
MELTRALVIGASGFFGRRALAELGERGVGTFHTRPFVGGVRFDALTMRIGEVLDCVDQPFSHAVIPYGAIDMEGCARDPAGTSAVNVVAMIRVIQDLFKRGITPVFCSTDYIFDGSRALWRESDPAFPKMAYGAQKLAVEAWLGTRTEPWLVVRFSKVVSGGRDEAGQLGQWVNDIIAGKALRCADDQFYSPSFVEDLAGAVIRLTETGATGIYHVAGPERYSRLGLLHLLVGKIEAIRPEIMLTIKAVRLADMPFLEKRPLDTSLSIARLQDRISWRFTPMETLCERIARENFG